MEHSRQLDVVFGLHKCNIVDGVTRITVAVDIEDHGLYRLIDFGSSQELAMAARSTSINTLWHQRYGHLNVHYLS